MNAKILGNEPAFPVIPPIGDAAGYPYPASGITLRQHFAGLAMAGSLGGEPGSHLVPANLARESVAHADALLAELAKDQL